MSEKKQTKKVNVVKVQLFGLYGLIVAVALFWGGVWVGTQSAIQSQANEESIKASAVEEYKATLKAEQ